MTHEMGQAQEGLPLSLEVDTIYERGSNMNVEDLWVEEFKLLIQEEKAIIGVAKKEEDEKLSFFGGN